MNAWWFTAKQWLFSYRISRFAVLFGLALPWFIISTIDLIDRSIRAEGLYAFNSFHDVFVIPSVLVTGYLVYSGIRNHRTMMQPNLLVYAIVAGSLLTLPGVTSTFNEKLYHLAVYQKVPAIDRCAQQRHISHPDCTRLLRAYGRKLDTTIVLQELENRYSRMANLES